MGTPADRNPVSTAPSGCPRPEVRRIVGPATRRCTPTPMGQGCVSRRYPSLTAGWSIPTASLRSRVDNEEIRDHPSSDLQSRTPVRAPTPGRQTRPSPSPGRVANVRHQVGAPEPTQPAGLPAVPHPMIEIVVATPLAPSNTTSSSSPAPIRPRPTSGPLLGGILDRGPGAAGRTGRRFNRIGLANSALAAPRTNHDLRLGQAGLRRGLSSPLIGAPGGS